ncbi:MAG: ABC transporter substrate-binding protein [Fibrobacteres bacterium]|nr:ABC transporter substrate-binding protein [Fibrobacterota bacterium]
MKTIILFLPLLLIACKEAPVKELFIVSPHTPEIKKEFAEAFKSYSAKQGKKVSVKWIDVGGTGEAVEFVKSRNGEGRQAGGVDCFFGGGDLPFITLEGLDLLDTLLLPDTILDRFPSELNGYPLRSEKGKWIGAALSGFGILNNDKMAMQNNITPPTEWKDLAKPELHGFVAFSDPRYSGTAHVMFEIILQSYGWNEGWKILYGMAANGRTFDKGASMSAKSVAAGQTISGISIDFYAAAEIEKIGSHRLSFVLPANKTAVTPDGIAVLKYSKNRETAQEFVRFVLTDGQYLWLKKAGTPKGPARIALCRMAADSSVYHRISKDELTPVRNPFTEEAADSQFTFNSRLAGKRWALLNDMTASLLVNPQRKLRSSYLKNSAAYAPPLSEDEAMTIAPTWNKPENAVRRIKLMNEWTKTNVTN